MVGINQPNCIVKFLVIDKVGPQSQHVFEDFISRDIQLNFIKIQRQYLSTIDDSPNKCKLYNYGTASNKFLCIIYHFISSEHLYNALFHNIRQVVL